jgi:LysM repeat protein
MSDTAAKRPERRSRLAVRVLVSLALLGSLVAVASVVAGTLGGSGEPERTQQRRAGGQGPGEEARKRERPPQEYVVQSGDTLLGIAEKFGVPAKRLQRLNPDVDPQALSTGQVLRLR